MSRMLLILETTGILTWLWLPINCLLLFFDGVVYTCVALSYRLFQLMAQLNFNALSSWMTALVDRINAIIAVLILFILGYSLIQYLINPDKANDKTKAGGVAIIKNIAISAVLLISYGFIFGVMNEFTFVLVGTPSTYKYTYLNDLFGVENNGGDEGLIMRLIVGGESTLDDGTKVDYGRKLAITTLSSFLHGFEDDGLYNREEGWDKSMVGEVYGDALYADDFNLIGTLITIVGEIGRSIYYFPILSTALGAYIVYMIIKASIELGIRAFKLMVLQVIAPIAIITIMKDGASKSNNVWSKYLSTLTKTYTDAFIRIGAMYFAFAFISVAYNNLDQLFAGAPEADGFTKVCLYGLIIVSALKLGKELPTLIDGIFGSKLAENNKVGLGQFLSSAGGVAIGAGVGGLAGFTTRFRNSREAGLGAFKSLFNAARGGVSGMLTGGFSGGVAGAKNKGENISSFFKTGREAISEGWRAGAPGIGGFLLGLKDEYGTSGSSREKQNIEDLKAVRDELFKNASKGSITSKTIMVNGTPITYNAAVDYSKGSGTAAIDAWRISGDGRKLAQDIEAAHQRFEHLQNSGAAKADIDAAFNDWQNLTAAKNSFENEIDSGFGSGTAALLGGNAEYLRLAKKVASSTGVSIADLTGRSSGLAIRKAEVHLSQKIRRGRSNGIQSSKGGN